MRPFVLMPEQKNSPNLLYDCYAISNHFGGCGGGHYTAYAKNPVYQKWFNFDDTDVSRASEANVVTQAAYVLFYKRRGV